MKKIFIIAFIGSLLMTITTVHAFDFSISISPLESLSGHTTYQIGGERITASGDRFIQRDPTSELKFPLDVSVANLGTNLQFEFANTSALEINLEFKFNINDDAGKMEDSDWGIYYGESSWPDPDSLDIYSESDAELEALLMGFHLRYYFPTIARFLKLSLGLGSKYEHFEYEISNLDQWYPSLEDIGVYPGHDLEPGLVLTYEVTYQIPLILETGINFLIGKHVNLGARLGYAPFVTAKNEDHHLLRNLVSKGDCEGDATLFSLEGYYTFNFGLFLSPQLEYMNIQTDGISTGYEYGAYDGTIEQRIESEQTSFALIIGYNF